jgi:hypothetical protein
MRRVALCDVQCCVSAHVILICMKFLRIIVIMGCLTSSGRATRTESFEMIREGMGIWCRFIKGFRIEIQLLMAAKMFAS